MYSPKPRWVKDSGLVSADISIHSQVTFSSSVGIQSIKFFACRSPRVTPSFSEISPSNMRRCTLSSPLKVDVERYRSRPRCIFKCRYRTKSFFFIGRWSPIRKRNIETLFVALFGASISDEYSINKQSGSGDAISLLITGVVAVAFWVSVSSSIYEWVCVETNFCATVEVQNESGWCLDIHPKLYTRFKLFIE